MAFDGVPKLGFIINSRIKPDFLKMSDALIKSGIRICVQSYEPHINDLYFEQNKGSVASSISVIKNENYESSDAHDLSDGCVVSASGGIELAYTIAKSAKIAKHLKINKLVSIATLAVGLLIACFAVFFVTRELHTLGIFEVLRTNLTTVFNALMFASLIPVVFEIIYIIKNKDK